MAYTNPYLTANKDVAAAYSANGQGMSEDQYAQWHYQNYGTKEGRTPSAAAPAAASITPAASPAAASTTPTGTGLLAQTAAATAAATPAASTTASTSVSPLASDETVEGRLNGLLSTDANGNYTNQVVRQANDRAAQTFATRGLLNSSMAAQAGQEAVISKAADIAATDATAQANRNQTSINNTNTVAATQTANTETLRQNYLAAADRVSAAYQSNVASINTSNMSPEDKSVAIAQAGAVRDGEMTYNNNLYNSQPNWQSAWLAVASPTGGTAVSAINNTDTLANIANDPAQSAADRAAAAQRLAELQAQQTQAAAVAASTPTAAPAPAYSDNFGGE